MDIIIDRFEGDFAVAELEDGTMVDIPRAILPGISEGDVVSVVKNEQETKGRRNRIKRLFDEVFDDKA